jgi:hypothetical protein
MTPEAQKRVAADREYARALLQGTPNGEPGSKPSPRRNEMPPSYNTGRLNRADGPEDRAFSERCLGLSIPSFGGRIYHRFVQSPGVLAIYYEPSGHAGGNRVIPIGDRPHLPQHIRLWLGDSVARWEGNTLVVDTTNFTHKTSYQGSRQNLHLIERFTRLDADTIEYKITVEDPTTWTKPWTILAHMGKRDAYENALYEPNCQEGNYGIIGIMSSTRAAEKLFKEGKGPDPATQDNASGGGGED